MPLDTFGKTLDKLSICRCNCFSITPHDNAVPPFLSQAVYVSTGRALLVRAFDGSFDVTLTNVANAMILDIRAISIRTIGTTATNLIDLG